eukprot:4934723-Alexandrium_andersonii.AAC.1
MPQDHSPMFGASFGRGLSGRRQFCPTELRPRLGGCRTFHDDAHDDSESSCPQALSLLRLQCLRHYVRTSLSSAARRGWMQASLVALRRGP